MRVRFSNWLGPVTLIDGVSGSGRALGAPLGFVVLLSIP